MKIRGVVFDWAGTIIDFGSLAPMGAFVKLFANHGVQISIAQARIPMGLPKLAHIEALGALPDIARQWEQSKGGPFTAGDAAALLREFEPMSALAAMENKDFIPGFLDTYRWLQANQMRVATTTGYTRKIMAPLIAHAESQGFVPELVICCDDVTHSRPHPMGMERCMDRMGLTGQASFVVKVDDTVPGLQEAFNAGCWTVGVAASGNALGWSWEQWVRASDDERAPAVALAHRTLLEAGAHVVVDSVANLPTALQAIEARIRAGEAPVRPNAG